MIAAFAIAAAVTVVTCQGIDDTAALQLVVSPLSAPVPADIRIEGSCLVDGTRGVRVPPGTRIDARRATFRLQPACAPTCRVFWVRNPGSATTPAGTPRTEIIGGDFAGDLSPTCSSCMRNAVVVDGVDRVSIRDATFHDWATDAVWIGGPYAGSFDVVLADLDIRGSRRNGISITNARDVLVERSYIGDMADSPLVGAGIDVEPNPGERVVGLTIRDCVFSGNKMCIFDHPGKGLPGIAHEISGNRCDGDARSSHGFAVNSVDGLLLYRNVVSGVPIGISVGSATEALRARNTRIVANDIIAARPLLLAGVLDSVVWDNLLNDGAGRCEQPVLGSLGYLMLRAREPIADEGIQ